MKVAICLYGQPRNHKIGFNNIKNFIDNNKNCSFDVFFHAWKIDDGDKYLSSPFRKIQNSEIHVDDMNYIINDLINIYKPILFKFEKSIDHFQISDKILNSSVYKNSHPVLKSNINNTLSQCYSRNQVRNLILDHINQTNNNYDMIVTSRFDFTRPINFEFKNIDKTKVYVSDFHSPKQRIADNFIILPQNIYLKWFDIFNDVENIINNKEIELKMNEIGQRFVIGIEEIIMANYLKYFNMNNIIYTNKIPDFR
jgi:hypothetical protein